MNHGRIRGGTIVRCIVQRKLTIRDVTRAFLLLLLIKLYVNVGGRLLKWIWANIHSGWLVG